MWRERRQRGWGRRGTPEGEDVRTTTIELTVEPAPNAPPVGCPPILYIDFWPEAQFAESDVGLGPASEGETIKRLTEAVTATHGSEWGPAGPPELDSVNDCLG